MNIMLVTCPECRLQISDKATVCPHCGFPLHPASDAKRKTRTSNRRRRLPNGFGQISEIKGQNLKNPFRVMVCVGKTEEGRPICKLLKPEAYFPTYNDAYAALVEYNKNPYELDDGMTMRELYERWSRAYYQHSSKQLIHGMKAAWAYCSDIYDMKVVDVKARHLKHCISTSSKEVFGKQKSAGYATQTKMKTLFNLMFDYAVEYELVDKNQARVFGLSSIAKKPQTSEPAHMSFSDDEMDTLWTHINDIPYIDMLLIQCYSGWRPQELGLIKVEDVDVDKWVFSGGMKTEAGRNRMVPIHSRIRPLVLNKYNEALSLNSMYLFNCTAQPNKDYFFTYNRYRYYFLKIIEKLQLDPKHRPHDGRKQFVTMAKKYNVDEYAIKYIVGHVISDITESVYTDRNIEWLGNEIEKIK